MPDASPSFVLRKVATVPNGAYRSDGVVIIPNYVSVVGSSVENLDKAHDLDLVIRDDDGAPLYYKESVAVLLRKFLDPRKTGKALHLVFNPQGPHQPGAIPVFDLVLNPTREVSGADEETGYVPVTEDLKKVDSGDPGACFWRMLPGGIHVRVCGDYVTEGPLSIKGKRIQDLRPSQQAGLLTNQRLTPGDMAHRALAVAGAHGVKLPADRPERAFGFLLGHPSVALESPESQVWARGASQGDYNAFIQELAAHGWRHDGKPPKNVLPSQAARLGRGAPANVDTSGMRPSAVASGWPSDVVAKAEFPEDQLPEPKRLRYPRPTGDPNQFKWDPFIDEQQDFDKALVGEADPFARWSHVVEAKKAEGGSWQPTSSDSTQSTQGDASSGSPDLRKAKPASTDQLDRPKRIRYQKPTNDPNAFKWDLGLQSPDNLDKSANQGGVMVAVYPPRPLAAKLARPNGERPDEIHLTLAYLGDMDAFPPPYWESLLPTMQAFAAQYPSFTVTVNGLGRFASDGDGGHVIYANADAPALPTIREALVEKLRSLGYPVNDEHGYTPHLTLEYLAPSERVSLSEPPTEEFKANALTVVIGNDKHTFPLRGEGWGEHAEGEAADEPHIPASTSLSDDDPLVERLADLEHEQWARITQYALNEATPEDKKRWEGQIQTAYPDLSEPDKEKDREWARRVLRIINGKRSDVARVLAKAEELPDLVMPFVKADDEKRYTLSVVYLASDFDNPVRDAHSEIASADELEKAQWQYVQNAVDRSNNAIYAQHGMIPGVGYDKPIGRWVGIISWPFPLKAEFHLPGQQSTVREVPANSIFMSVIWTPEAWALVKAGKIRGLSFAGKARRLSAD